jgi:hypothetical protein
MSMWPNSYETLRRRAQQRVSSIQHTSIDSPFGTIEYAERGEGDPVWCCTASSAGSTPPS